MKFKNFLLGLKLSILYLFASTILFAQSSNNFNSADSFVNSNLFERIKNISLSNNKQYPALTIGGELRERFRGFYNIDYGDEVPDEDTYLMQRYGIYADLYINKTFHFFTQLNTSHVNYKNSVSTGDQDNLGVVEAYIDLDFGSFPMDFRLGRQELNFGSGTIIGRREGRNNPVRFDGFLNKIELNKISAAIFIASPMEYKLGFFDNITDKNNLAFGTYWTISLINNNILDIYYFGNDNKNAKINGIEANEIRHSIGTRIYNSKSPFSYSAEAAWQFGTFGEQKIAAWQLLASLGYSWQGTRLNPELGIRGSIYSSENDSTDNKTNLFRQISGRPPVNRMVPVGTANIMMLAPSGGISITEDFDISLTYYAVWRRKASDGVYSRSLTMERPPDTAYEKRGRFIASGPYLRLRYDAIEHLSLSLIYGIFSPGKYLKNTGKGETYQGFTLTAQYSF